MSESTFIGLSFLYVFSMHGTRDKHILHQIMHIFIEKAFVFMTNVFFRILFRWMDLFMHACVAHFLYTNNCTSTMLPVALVRIKSNKTVNKIQCRWLLKHRFNSGPFPEHKYGTIVQRHARITGAFWKIFYYSTNRLNKEIAQFELRSKRLH